MDTPLVKLNGHSGIMPGGRGGRGGRGGTVAVGGYDNARSTRLRPNAGQARGGSADSQRDPWTLDALRRQTQHLDRNNVVARGIAMAAIDAIVSDGFNLQFHTSDREWNRLAEDTLNDIFGWPIYGQKAQYQRTVKGRDYAPNTGSIDIRRLWCIDEMAAEAVRCAFFEGDLTFLKTVSEEGGSLQAIEAERIQNPDGLGSFNQRNFAGGVELDNAGRPVRFHVREWSDLGMMASGQTRPIAAADVIFLRNPMRGIVGSTRGEPQMAAALDRLERIARYNTAAAVGAELQASMPGFIKSNNPADLQVSMAGETVTRTGDTNTATERWIEVRPGEFKFLGIGEEVQFPPASQPIAGFNDYVTMQVLQICMDLRIPVSAAMLDGRGLNLSTIRSILQFSWRNTRRWQGWLTRAFYTPVTLWRTAMLIRSGGLPFNEEWFRHGWTPPPPPVMDPKAEIDAGIAAINGTLKSQKRVMLELFGIDFDEEMEQIAAERATMKELGIERVGLPGQNVGGNTGGAGNSDGAETPPGTAPPAGEDPEDPEAEGGAAAGGD